LCRQPNIKGGETRFKGGKDRDFIKEENLKLGKDLENESLIFFENK
jgi:hypothetical protein